MPVYRTPDGKIVEERTEVTPPGGKQRGETSGQDPNTVTRQTGSAQPTEPPAPAGARGRYDDPTVVRPPGKGIGTTPPASREGERTVVAGRIPQGDKQSPDAEAIDPVTGWLVVVDGPGKGSDVRIATGRNSLGRDRGNRVALPFGDTEISREKHLWITYDHRHQTFSVAPGADSANLAYLNDTPIDERLPLPDGATIAVGKTTLRFVALCGDKFHWSDAS